MSKVRCVFEMTAAELLAENVLKTKPTKSVLISDLGHGWLVTEYSSDASGLGSEHITVQATTEEIERVLVKMRRSTTPEKIEIGEVIIDPAEIVKALSEDKPPK